MNECKPLPPNSSTNTWCAQCSRYTCAYTCALGGTGWAPGGLQGPVSNRAPSMWFRRSFGIWFGLKSRSSKTGLRGPAAWRGCLVEGTGTLLSSWGHDHCSTVAWTIPGLTEGASWPPPPAAIGGGWWYGGGVGAPYIPCGGAPCIGGGGPCIGGGAPPPGGGGAYVGPGRCKGPNYRRTTTGHGGHS